MFSRILSEMSNILCVVNGVNNLAKGLTAAWDDWQTSDLLEGIKPGPPQDV